MSLNTIITSHYAAEGIRARLENALVMSGFANGQLEWSQLALADQFHAGGLEASKEIGLALGVKEGDHVLDVGSGFGGPARFLAGTYGCKVTGIDLTPEYVEIATYLTDRTGQQDKVSFRLADALALPYEDAAFDDALTQHVGMNVQDKSRFYSEIARVLKPGGKLAIYDIVRSSEEPPVYPLPWASEPSFSFVVHPEEVVQALREAGFEDITQEDKTPLVRKSFADLARLMQSPDAAAPLNLVALLGGAAKEAVRNLGENINAGRLRAQLFVARKERRI